MPVTFSCVHPQLRAVCVCVWGGTLLKVYRWSRMSCNETRAAEQNRMVDKMVTSILPRVHSVVIGPGLGRDAAVLDAVARVIEHCKEKGMPCVIDADGLWLVTQRPELVRLAFADTSAVVKNKQPCRFVIVRRKKWWCVCGGGTLTFEGVCCCPSRSCSTFGGAALTTTLLIISSSQAG